MDSTVTAFITLSLVLQAASVTAGKIIRDQMNFIWPKRGTERRPAGETRLPMMELGGVTDLPGHSGIMFTVQFRFSRSSAKVVTSVPVHLRRIHLDECALSGNHQTKRADTVKLHPAHSCREVEVKLGFRQHTLSAE